MESMKMDGWGIARCTHAAGVGDRASIGMIGLSPDRVGVWDVERFLDGIDGVAVFSTRIPMASVGTPETVRALGTHLTEATRLLVTGSRLDVVGFSCTSGTVAIGLDNIERAVRMARPGVPVATPIGAGLQALRLFGARRISMLAPYQISLANIVSEYLIANGLAIDRKMTFNLAGDLEMSVVSPDDIVAAAVECTAPESDALFISCTGLRTSGIIDRIEQRLGRPVVTSNQALSWACLRLAGVTDRIEGQGRLLREH
jgi:maleate isomerase